MSKKIFQGLLLLAVFTWNESARAECKDCCKVGAEHCLKVCEKIEGKKNKTICSLACSAGKLACSGGNCRDLIESKKK